MMKTVFVLMLSILIFDVLNTLGQESNRKVYVKVYGAYGLLSPGSYNGSVSKPLSGDTSYFRVSKKGMGQGLRAGGGFGIVLRDYLSIGIDGEYLKGSTLKQDINRSYANVRESGVTTLDYSILSIIPNVTFQAFSDRKFSIYNRLGIIIGIPLNVTEDYQHKAAKATSANEQVITTTYHAEYELENGIGYQASIGLQARISKKFHAFLEISGHSLSLKRIKYEEIERSRSESNQAPGAGGFPIVSLSDHSRNIIEYKDEGSETYTSTGPANNKVYTYTYAQKPVNINAIVAAVGVMFRF